ncbi:MAG: hypothetical protein U5L45_23655 [Saprospiraceae bacterium]|nr:hypothetical protein [Saprospiraceae bacterium]
MLPYILCCLILNKGNYLACCSLRSQKEGNVFDFSSKARKIKHVPPSARAKRVRAK